ncbi:cytochrome-c peroxidase [Bacteroidota bacterium]
MSHFLRFLVLCTILWSVSGCKEKPEEDYVTTPYTLEIPAWFPPIDQFIPADNQMTVEGVALGRKLFYDPILSGDNTQACASCHLQENGFSDPRAFSEGISGEFGNRNAMAVINLGWNQFGFFWDGRDKTLEDQALGPVVNPIEMNTTWPEVEAKLNADAEYSLLFKQAYGIDVIDSLHVAKAIAQFERTLISGNSKFDRFYNQKIEQLTALEARGFVLYTTEAGDCFHCHGLGGLITDNRFHNNGLDQMFKDSGRYKVTGNADDIGLFRTPTLRNIELTAPYMHDGRFFTLEQVVEHYSEHVKPSPTIDPLMKKVGTGGLQLSEQDKKALVAFLKTFTDSKFATNTNFSKPN